MQGIGEMVGSWWFKASLICALLASGAACPRAKADVAASKVIVVVGDRACEAERKVAGVLAQRLAKRTGIAAEVVPESKARFDFAHRPEPVEGQEGARDLTLFIGLPANHDRLAALCAENGVATPTAKDPGPEGFAVKTLQAKEGAAVLAAGVDQRGVLYSAGEILRQVTYGDGSIGVPEIAVRTAPAFRYRGFQAKQGGTMTAITGARAWTADEWHDTTLDFALAGANIFPGKAGDFEFIKSFDLLSATSALPNQWRSSDEYPPEWQATESGKFVCPSIPAARKALLANWEKDAASRPDHDILRFPGGDPGGCNCPRCRPWGRTFIHLCEEMARVWLKYHPKSEVHVINQGMDNAGDQAIFDYLNEKPRTWLAAVDYGPGSNALSPYFRAELRTDLFVYPGAGPLNRYLREMLNNIPKYQHIVHFSDITHWVSAQYQVANPEPHLLAVYGRRMFHVRPRAFYKIFQAIMPFAEGDIIYCEGYHDEFHQYLWNRLLWNPNRSLDDIMLEYARLYFGPRAAPEMVQAMLQFEENLEAPLETNPGMDRFYLLVQSAGRKIPPNLMRDNHRWRMFMQRAATDKYLQLKLRLELDREQRATRALQQGLAAGDAEAGRQAAVAVMDEPVETPEMAALREEAKRLGEESNAIFGVRDVGYFRLDQDLVGLGWLRKQLAAGPAAGGERLRLLEGIARYEDPGPGGFYDDLGDKSRQPHLVKGTPRDLSEYMDPANRPSQNTVVYSYDDGKGVALRYTGLDLAARYRVRITLVAPRLPGSDRGTSGLKQTLLANGQVLAKDIETPVYTAQQFEYDVPPELTRGGTLDLWLEKGTGGVATVASEVWLIKM